MNTATFNNDDLRSDVLDPLDTDDLTTRRESRTTLTTCVELLIDDLIAIDELTEVLES